MWMPFYIGKLSEVRSKKVRAAYKSGEGLKIVQ